MVLSDKAQGIFFRGIFYTNFINDNYDVIPVLLYQKNFRNHVDSYSLNAGIVFYGSSVVFNINPDYVFIVDDYPGTTGIEGT